MNRHLKIAFFMTPLLAIIAYVLTGYYLSPQEINDQNNKFRLLGTCKPRENACIFILGKIELKLISNEKQQQLQLAVISNEPIESLSLAMAETESFKQFQMMKSSDQKYWQISLDEHENLLNYHHLRMAMKFKNEAFYAESKVYF